MVGSDQGQPDWMMCWISSVCPSWSAFCSSSHCFIFQEADLYGLYYCAPVPSSSGHVWPVGTIDRISENWGRVRAGYVFLWIFPTMSPLRGSEFFSQFRAIQVTLSIPLYTLSFRKFSFPYSLALRGGNHSFLTPIIPEYYIISVFFWYYDKSWLSYYKK